MDFSQVKKWIIPEGEAIKVINVLDSSVLWQKVQRILKEWRGLSPLTCTPTVANNFEEVRLYGNSKQGILPDGYTQLECTKNTGDVFIDTGIVPTDNTILKIRYRQTTKLGSNYILGSRTNSAATIYGIGGASSGAKINSTYAGSSVVSNIIRVLNVIYNVEASFINGVNTLTVTDETNNVTDTKSTTYTWSGQNTTFKFYGWNNDNYINAGTEVFEVEIIQDGVSVYHAYPCKQGETVGFYDIVGNTFTSNVNLTSGNTLPTPTAPLEIESVGDKQVLPYGYTQLESINNNGTAYLDLGISIGTSDKVTFDISWNTLKIVPWFGAYNAGGSYSTNSFVATYFGGANSKGFYPNMNIGVSFTNVLANTRYLIKWNGVNALPTFNGTPFGNPIVLPYPDFTPNANAYLCTRNQGGVAGSIDDMTIYGFEVEGKMKLIPARRNSDGVVGMYDTVSNTFLHSAGTGEFIAGAEVGQGGYKVPVTVSGKNLFNQDDFFSAVANWNKVDGIWQGQIRYVAEKYNGYDKCYPINVDVASISIKARTEDSKAIYVKLFYTDGTSTSASSSTSPDEFTSIFLASDPNKKIKGIALSYGSNSYAGIIDMIVVEGTYTKETMPSYQPYVEPTTTNIYINEPLRKIGEYADTMSVTKSKNLLNIPKFQSSFKGSFSQGIKLKAGNYYLSAYNEDGTTDGIRGGSTFSMALLDSTGAAIQSPNVRNAFTLTEDEAEKLASIKFYWAPTSYTGSSEYINIQLEEGDTATPYTPYNGSNVTVVRNIKEVILDGDESYSRRSDVSINYTRLTDRLVNRDVMLQTAICNKLNVINGAPATAPVGTLSINVSNYYVHFFTEFGGDVDAFKNWLTTNNVTIDYILATPTTETYSLSNTINAVEGTTIIDVDTKVPPSEVYASEWVEE